MPLSSIKKKIKEWDDAKHQTRLWKQDGRTIVFTNGCFDILHYGHIHYLAEARSLGDYLIVGLNSKDSVSRLKGSHRPIQDDMTRSMMLASLEYVDMVVYFDSDTPLELINYLLPDILVKGGDYVKESIVGYDTVVGHGGEVRVLSFVDGYSTSSIERKIKERD